MKSNEPLHDEEVFADLFVKSDDLYKISVGEGIVINKYKFDEPSSTYEIVKDSNKPINVFKDFKIESFCYSIVINYSLYGFNTKNEGDWIFPLFHKNDSYQTPITLNPFREEGVINVNTRNL